MADKIKAIQTEYNGYKFRSRLEARWAVFFDALGVEYEYEKEGYDLGDLGYYLPDFWLPEHDAFIEIKGTSPTDNEKDKIRKLSELSVKACFLYSGLPEKNIDESCSSPPECFAGWGGYCYNLHPAKPFHPKNECDQDYHGAWHYMCPFCGDNYVHFKEPEMKSCDDGSAWDGRGSAIRIPMWGECEHAWTLLMGFHKGYTFIKIEDGHGVNYDNFLFVLSGEDVENLRNAHYAAKQARFEHGETPNG